MSDGSPLRAIDMTCSGGGTPDVLAVRSDENNETGHAGVECGQEGGLCVMGAERHGVGMPSSRCCELTQVQEDFPSPTILGRFWH